MPNYCYNSVTLTTEDTAKADAFEAALEALSSDTDNDGAGLFGHFLPRPTEEEDNWYSWNIDNWGTKWEVYGVEWQRDENSFYLNFDTAWSPPIAFYEFIESEEGGCWQVDAMYEEPGMSFVGRYADGFDDYQEYDFDNTDWRDSMSEDMIEFADLESRYEDYLEWREDEDEEE